MAKQEKKKPGTTFGGDDATQAPTPPVETPEETPSAEDLQGINENQAEVIKELNQTIADNDKELERLFDLNVELTQKVADLEKEKEEAPIIDADPTKEVKPVKLTPFKKAQALTRKISGRYGDGAVSDLFSACGSNAKTLKKVDEKLYPDIIKMAEAKLS